jgi:hypothetical protein
MKTFFLFITIFILYSSISFSQTDRWLYLGTKNSVDIYIDVESILYNKQANMYQVYSKTVDSDGSYQLHLQNYYCNKRRMDWISDYTYDKFDNLIHQLSTNDYDNDILPESNPEKIYYFLCK